MLAYAEQVRHCGGCSERWRRWSQPGRWLLPRGPDPHRSVQVDRLRSLSIWRETLDTLLTRCSTSTQSRAGFPRLALPRASQEPRSSSSPTAAPWRVRSRLGHRVSEKISQRGKRMRMSDPEYLVRLRTEGDHPAHEREEHWPYPIPASESGGIRRYWSNGCKTCNQFL